MSGLLLGAALSLEPVAADTGAFTAHADDEGAHCSVSSSGLMGSTERFLGFYLAHLAAAEVFEGGAELELRPHEAAETREEITALTESQDDDRLDLYRDELDRGRLASLSIHVNGYTRHTLFYPREAADRYEGYAIRPLVVVGSAAAGYLQPLAWGHVGMEGGGMTHGGYQLACQCLRVVSTVESSCRSCPSYTDNGGVLEVLDEVVQQLTWLSVDARDVFIPDLNRPVSIGVPQSPLLHEQALLEGR